MKRAIVFFLFFFSCLLHADIQISVDPKEVQLDQTFRLNLTSKQVNNNMGLPNLTPLNDNFFILGTERSLSYSIINGQTESISQWVILLKPKKAGMLTIPSLHVGQEQSPSGSINVTAGITKPSSTPDKIEPNSNVFLETNVDETHPLLNQQILYTVKLFTNKPIANAHYEPPVAEDALVIPLGEGKRYETESNGQTFAVEEQRYAIFPQKSGIFKITPPSFRAILFGFNDVPIQVKSKPTILTISPIPETEKNRFWLPAHSVSLTESYSNTKNLKQNDTLTRTITIKAEAMPAQLLPSIPLKKSLKYEAYAEQPEIRNQIKNQVLTGESTIKITYIFNSSNQVTLPAISIPWYNITSHKAEIATLPSVTLNILPGSKAQELPKTAKSIIKPEPPPIVAKDSSISWHFWLIIGEIIVLVLALFLLYLLYINRPSQTIKRQVKAACFKNQPEMAAYALINWAKLKWPEETFLNLYDVIKKINDTACKKELQKLANTLYNPIYKDGWQGKLLWKCILSYRLNRSKNTSMSLPPINPQ